LASLVPDRLSGWFLRLGFAGWFRLVPVWLLGWFYGFAGSGWFYGFAGSGWFLWLRWLVPDRFKLVPSPLFRWLVQVGSFGRLDRFIWLVQGNKKAPFVWGFAFIPDSFF
jgi:hypothetical protein